MISPCPTGARDRNSQGMTLEEKTRSTRTVLEISSSLFLLSLLRAFRLILILVLERVDDDDDDGCIVCIMVMGETMALLALLLLLLERDADGIIVLFLDSRS
jgi:hypothetical protein